MLVVPTLVQLEPLQYCRVLFGVAAVLVHCISPAVPAAQEEIAGPNWNAGRCHLLVLVLQMLDCSQKAASTTEQALPTVSTLCAQESATGSEIPMKRTLRASAAFKTLRGRIGIILRRSGNCVHHAFSRKKD
ncbi:MAG: hypothetical protein HGA90_01295 [Alphaproteobacteria bacterium]|nr:hypothetical protein [Alphaproteobacteria bacterium]